MMRILFISACILLFLACRKEATVKLPEARSLPVMYAYICPDDTLIKLKLMASSPLYKSNEVDVRAAVPDGIVKISGAQGTRQLVFNQYTGYYELSTATYPVLPGQVYKVTAMMSNGDVASAETQVPAATIPINAVSVEYIKENAYVVSDRIKISFTDEPGTANYYRMAALYLWVDYFQKDTITDDTFINELYSDINHDGENVSIDARFYGTPDSTRAYDIYLYNCSASYYNFHKSIRNYSGGDPFSEPSLTYSNVQGGFGCFGAYTRSRIRYTK